MATLTYVYSDSTAVLGPLATYAEPHSYDLCEGHAARLTAPRGWEVVRLQVDDHGPAGPSHDDLLALVEAVREAAREPVPRGSRAGRLPASAGDRSGLLRDHGGPGEHGDPRGYGGHGLRSDPRRPGPGDGPPPGYGPPLGRGVGRRGHLRVLGPVEEARPEQDGPSRGDVPFDGSLTDP